MKTISDILKEKNNRKFATNTGTKMHKEMQRLVINDEFERGNPDIIKKIKEKPELLPYFSENAQTEVPIAGIFNEKLISRRIDRLIKTDDEIIFIDYKTDVNKNQFRDKYINQMKEYSHLLKNVYPNHKILGKILWLSDFSLESICCLK